MESEREDLDELFAAMGYVVYTWAWVEQSIDMCISVIVAACGPDEKEPERPRGLKRKLQYLRRALNRHARYAVFKDEGIKIVERIMNTKDLRHDFVHSVLSDIDMANKVFVFDAIDIGPERHKDRSWTFKLGDFPKTQQTLEVLAMDVLGFSSRFAKSHIRQ